MKDHSFVISIISGFICGCIMYGGFTLGKVVTTNKFEKEAIENNCAEYNSKTKEFQWIKK